MMLTEQTTVPLSALPVAALKDHLRLGTGFADASVQDSVLEGCLRAAFAMIEGRIGKVLVSHVFSCGFAHWRSGSEQTLPVAPVRSIQSVVIVDRQGVENVVPAERYFLEQDLHRPKLVAAGVLLPAIPAGGSVEIVFDAGFGPAWSDVPADLRQAVLLLAAHFHEHRHAVGDPKAVMPFGVAALIERWRNVRILGGASA